jgi:hypothetical protein
MYTSSRSHYSEAQQDANWDNLSPEQRAYFNHLAAEDPERTGQAFFEDTVPPAIQDNPEQVESYLNGNEELGIADRDWSHDTSRANGGSGSADNGRFEDSSINRSRGSDNSTLVDQTAADLQSQADVQILEAGSLAEDAKQAADLTLAAEGIEATSYLATAGEFALDALGPVVGGVLVAKATADQFDKTEHKVIAATTTGTLTAIVLTTPIGQLGLGCYLSYKLVKAGHRFLTRNVG